MRNLESEHRLVFQNIEKPKDLEAPKASEKLSSLRQEVELELSERAQNEVEHFAKSGRDAKERYILYMTAKYLLNRPVKETDSLEELQKVFDGKAGDQIGVRFSHGYWFVEGANLIGMDRTVRAKYLLHVHQMAKDEQWYKKKVLDTSVEKFIDRLAFVFDANSPKAKPVDLAQPRAGERPWNTKSRWVNYFLLKKFGGYADPLWDADQMDDQVDNAFYDDLKYDDRSGNNSFDDDDRERYSEKALARVRSAKGKLEDLYDEISKKGLKFTEEEVLAQSGPGMAAER
jgi:hypothetical protein